MHMEVIRPAADSAYQNLKPTTWNSYARNCCFLNSLGQFKALAVWTQISCLPFKVYYTPAVTKYAKKFGVQVVICASKI